MADSDSDSSGADDIETDVLLGYASKEPTGDDFSQLGGHPIWLDGKTPSGSLAKCKVCNGYMNLVLQLHGDIPDRYPGHERRLYVWSCRRKACRRKEGSQRAFRAIRTTSSSASSAAGHQEPPAPVPSTTATPNLGQTLFGITGSAPSMQANPFATSSSASAPSANPFSTANKSNTDGEVTASTLPETFAQKARISPPDTTVNSTFPPPSTPWPSQSDFPDPYPTYYIDPEKEYLESPAAEIPSSTARLDDDAGQGSSSSASDLKDAFESSMDKTFQRFADRLAQNPEQVLRYEFNGPPLLYSKSDAVGKRLAAAAADGPQKVKTSGGGGFGRCENCGAERVFELQLTPHAITVLEVEEMSINGMDWGTMVLAVCSQDCAEQGQKSGEVGYLEEWVGVQWEETADKRK